MKKLRKLLFLVVATVFSMVSMTNVNAAVDQTITFHNRNLSGVTKISGAGSTYKWVDTSVGTRIGLCLNQTNSAPSNGTKLYLKDEVTTPALVYILNNGYGGTWNKSVIGSGSYTNDQKYYITQLAIWMAQGSLSPSKVKSSGNALATPALNLYNASQKYTLTPNKITLSGGTKFTLTSDGKYYKSDAITIKGSGFSKASITLVNAPAGSDIVINNTSIKSGSTNSAIKPGASFYVRVPADKVAGDLNVKAVVNATGVNEKVYKYESKTANRQNIGLLFKDNVKLTASVTIKLTAKGALQIIKVDNSTGTEVKLSDVKLTVKDSTGKVVASWTTTDTNNPYTIKNLTPGTYTVIEESAPAGYIKAKNITVKVTGGKTIQVKVVNTKNPSKIVISKQDITTKTELPGAHLVIKDANGTVVEEWTSTNSPHYVKTLTPGKYTLTETIAPEGYQLSTETITFTVSKDGGVEQNIVMYNTPIPEKTKIKISKQDITTGKELPGAHLVVKDSTGKIIDEWVSTSTPHYLSNLSEGKYTLIETISPKGYGLSDEVIEFEVKADGGVEQTVVMYNSPIPVTADMPIGLICGGLLSFASLAGFAIFKMIKRHA
jgi:uncharacterized surface anchored protein